MTIETVRDNLVNTIKGKEKLLAKYRLRLRYNQDEWIVNETAIKFLEINLVELNNILVDVEACLD